MNQNLGLNNSSSQDSFLDCFQNQNISAIRGKLPHSKNTMAPQNLLF